MKYGTPLKMIIAYIIFGVCAFFAIAAFCSGRFKSTALRQEAASLRSECSYISSEYVSSYESSSLTLAGFKSHVDAVAQYTDADIYVISTNGSVLVASTMELGGETQTIEGFSIDSLGSSYYSTGDFFGYYDTDVLVAYATITRSGRTSGYVMMTKPLDDIYETSDAYKNHMYAALPILFALSGILFVVFLLAVSRPLRKIMNAAGHYRKGDFSVRITTKRRDEIGNLARTIDFMARELGALESDQRKLISNISHDFRSPLTSIKGYAEAMEDGTIAPEEYNKYLDVIIFQANRLEKLTQSLRELNKYGNTGMLLNIRDYDLNAQMRRVVQSFETQATKRRISVSLILTGEELLVHADEDKIERVLVNLVDNAVKFSGNSSEIKLENSVVGNKVYVSVKDEGCGIPKEQIGKIWERFYKIDASRGKDKSGSGLGLAIVKEIIAAHKENINVISTEGVGTEFIFTLPAADDEE